jgi:hypothetical protein
VIVWLETPEGRNLERDLFASVPMVIHGFCELLSALPTSLWASPEFEQTDVIVSAPDGWPAVDRFFPELGTSEQAK